MAIVNKNNLLKVIIGSLLLAAMITWAVRDGGLIEKVDATLIVLATLVSTVINALNASAVKLIVDSYRGSIAYATALQVTALGALGNAMGGMPIGTALKYIVLYKESGLKIKEITVGLITLTIVISTSLLVFAAISAWGTEFPVYLKLTPSVVALGSIMLLVAFYMWSKRKKVWGGLHRPMFAKSNVTMMLMLGFAIAACFILNYWIVAMFLVPSLPTATLVFLSSIGILTSLGSLLQTVGGIQELSMGFAAYISGFNIIDGVELALVMRATSILSSGVILITLHFLPPRHQRQRDNI